MRVMCQQVAVGFCSRRQQPSLCAPQSFHALLCTRRRSLAMQAAVVNQAYDVLKKPLRRAHYIVSMGQNDGWHQRPGSRKGCSQRRQCQPLRQLIVRSLRPSGRSTCPCPCSLFLRLTLQLWQVWLSARDLQNAQHSLTWRRPADPYVRCSSTRLALERARA